MDGTGCRDYRRAHQTRRGFLQAGLSGLTLPSILRARELQAGAGQAPPDTAVIQYWLGGAASHFETYDPKPDAPSEFRGAFRPIYGETVPAASATDAPRARAAGWEEARLARCHNDLRLGSPTPRLNE